VDNNCAGTSRTVAQGLQYIYSKLERPIGFGTDWNALLGGPGPRFGPMSGLGVEGELEPKDDWAALVRSQRLAGSLGQGQGVRYVDLPSDWRSYRFRDTKLYEDTALVDPTMAVGDEGRFLWQGLVLRSSGADLDDAMLLPRLLEPTLGYAPALEYARALAGKTSLLGAPGSNGSDYHRAAIVAHSTVIPVAGENSHVQSLVQWIPIIEHVWDKMLESQAPPLQRSTAGPVREFDYNLDGLAHYGMLPDMLQDLKNVMLPQGVLDNVFLSAEEYLQVWERSRAAAATIPHPAPGVGP
jgi:hypothetical protein